MGRTIILGLLLLAAARAVAADETPKSTSAAADSAPAASAPSTLPSVTAANHPARKQAAASKAGNDKADAVSAAGPADPPAGDVKMSGMSILGNEDAPKSLVLVPWKSSQLADMPTVSRLLDSGTQPVDKDVFMRELAYYEFKSSSK